jgi:tetratricopeptide (TPR) repeat protein
MDESALPSNAKLCLKRAWEFAECADLAKATEEVDEAVRLAPNCSECWVTLGHFLRVAERFEESERAIRQAIQIKASDQYAWTEFGLLFRDRGSYERSAFCFRESARICPDYNVYTLLAHVELTFDPQAALRDAERALILKPMWEEALRVRDAAQRAITRKGDEAG